MRLDGDMRIEPADRRRGAVDLRRADIRRGVDHLPLQIRQRDHVVVDDAERADAGGGEIKQHRRAEPAGADHQHAGAAERGLSRPAHLAQHDVARIAFKFVGSSACRQYRSQRARRTTDCRQGARTLDCARRSARLCR